MNKQPTAQPVSAIKEALHAVMHSYDYDITVNQCLSVLHFLSQSCDDRNFDPRQREMLIEVAYDLGKAVVAGRDAHVAALAGLIGQL